MSKSKRINEIDEGKSLNLKTKQLWAKAYKIWFTEIVNGEYVDKEVYTLEIGDNGLPSHTQAVFDTLAALEIAVRNLANLRHWVVGGEW